MSKIQNNNRNLSMNFLNISLSVSLTSGFNLWSDSQFSIPYIMTRKENSQKHVRGSFFWKTWNTSLMDCPIQARSFYRHRILRIIPHHDAYKIGSKVYITSDPQVIDEEYRCEVPKAFTAKQVIHFFVSQARNLHNRSKTLQRSIVMSLE
jgi:hypothetical protein